MNKYFDNSTKREQFFEYTLTDDEAQAVTFPQPFASAPLFVTVQKDNNGANNGHNSRLFFRNSYHY